MEPNPTHPVVIPTPLPIAPPLHSKREHLHPTYSNAFRCIASACEDTCCRGWSVPIDQATYEKYRTHEALKSVVGSLIVLNTNAPSVSDYARFLDDQHLCSIHTQLGPDMLSVTCATYPRAIQPTAANPDAALNLSCPEAARLVLLDPMLLGPTPWPLRLPRAYAAIWQDDGTRAQPGEIRLNIRDFVLTLLSDRRYPIWQRLYLLGPMVRRLKTLAGATPLTDSCEANPRLVAHILADSARTAAGQRLQSVMDDLAAQPSDQLQLVTEILRLRLAEPPTPPRFIECIQEFELGLRTTTAHTEQEILHSYARGQFFLNALLEQHPQLIENYLLNHVFKNSFPFGRQPLRPGLVPSSPSDPENEHTLLCVLATLAQTLLIGMAAHHREAFNITHVVKLIQSLAKAIEHGTTFPARLAEYVQQRGLDAILVKSSKSATSTTSAAHRQPSPAYLPRTNPSPSLPAHF
jgi:lysine-N-methylase